MNILAKIITSALLLSTLSSAKVLMEKPKEESQFLPKMVMGLYGGNIKALNSALEREGDNFFRFGLDIGYQFTQTSTMYGEVDFFAPQGGMGINLGYQQALLPTNISPFIGAGLGFHYFFDEEDRKLEFGQRFSPGLNLNAGLELFKNQPVSIRIRGNYDIWFNDDTYQGIGGDIGFFFSFGRSDIRELKVD